MSEEHKITTGTISGATFKSIDIEPSIIVDGKSYTASEFNKAVEMLKQPQLNDNQQELLDDLKYVYSWQHSHAWDLFYYLVENDSEMFEEETLRNFQDMPEDDSLVVLEAFSRWVLERGKIGE
ncbi:hypothetical protein [Enterococcus sp.]|uniref:hypothetical protein n=1 Tax=Enterococcus sp. TaxID=35783 RepID=UPI00283FE975|nr:hypothetical protein [Enterococcus sp.]MDR3825847.1 hypothetical protein [Enterococcus sp.]